MGRDQKTKRRRGSVRIIGGDWRGRRIALAGDTAVRPTPDRVRETLFNWLAPIVAGARVLDLYAGSGILGLEALSRGARHATFVERDRRLARSLQAAALDLDAKECATVAAFAVERFLDGEAYPHDIVFADPPYRSVELATLCERLAADGWLAPGASVYLEYAADAHAPRLPAGFALTREGAAGQVRYGLAEWLATE